MFDPPIIIHEDVSKDIPEESAQENEDRSEEENSEDQEQSEDNTESFKTPENIIQERGSRSRGRGRPKKLRTGKRGRPRKLFNTKDADNDPKNVKEVLNDSNKQA